MTTQLGIAPDAPDEAVVVAYDFAAVLSTWPDDHPRIITCGLCGHGKFTWIVILCEEWAGRTTRRLRPAVGDQALGCSRSATWANSALTSARSCSLSSSSLTIWFRAGSVTRISSSSLSWIASVSRFWLA